MKITKKQTIVTPKMSGVYVKENRFDKLLAMLVSSNVCPDQLPPFEPYVFKELNKRLPWLNHKERHALINVGVPKLFSLVQSQYLNDIAKLYDVVLACEVLCFILLLNQFSDNLVFKTIDSQTFNAELEKILQRRHFLPQYEIFCLINQWTANVAKSFIKSDAECSKLVVALVHENCRQRFRRLKPPQRVRLLFNVFVRMAVPLVADVANPVCHVLLDAIQRLDGANDPETVLKYGSPLHESARLILLLGPKRTCRAETLISSWTDAFSRHPIEATVQTACDFLKLCLTFDRCDLFRKHKCIFDSVISKAYQNDAELIGQKDEIKYLLVSAMHKRNYLLPNDNHSFNQILVDEINTLLGLNL